MVPSAGSMTTLQSDIEALLAKGKGAYLAKGYREALAADRAALALAQESGDQQAQAVCHRFVGLSLYRLGAVADLTASETHLREAIALAMASNDTRLRLIVSNHLGATLRDLGRHDEAYDLFRAALRDATGAGLADVRARLLGNLGALLDELKQRASADDCYARYEELLEGTDDLRRLANARGLAGRAALLRGELNEAEWRFKEELRRGEECADARRRSSALRHLAHLATERLTREPAAEPKVAEELTLRAETAIAAATVAAAEGGDAKDQIRIVLRRVEFLRGRGRFVEAHRVLAEARSSAEALDHPVLTPKVDHATARVCADAGLHGEALWYLSRATRRRITVIKGIRSDRVRTMAQAWLDEVRVMAHELREEAFRVPRGDVERRQFGSLIDELDATLGPDPLPRPSPPLADPWTWHDGLRKRSEERLATALGADFGRLHPDSRGDLIGAEVTYHGAVDDLGRSAHLLALTLERELRERLVTPFRKVVVGLPTSILKGTGWKKTVTADPPPTLGMLLQMITWASTPPVRPHFEAALGRPALAGLAPVLVMTAGIRSVRDARLDVVDVRNAIAHGRPPREPLDRVAVDAIKRALMLDAPAVLEELLAWGLTR